MIPNWKLAQLEGEILLCHNTLVQIKQVQYGMCATPFEPHWTPYPHLGEGG